MGETENGYQPEDQIESANFELQSVVESLGFAETAEMEHIHALLVEAIRANNEPQRLQLYNDYCDQMESYIASSLNAAEAQIAGDIMIAGIYQEGGDIARYVEELGNALEYASNMGMTELVGSLVSEIQAYQ